MIKDAVISSCGKYRYELRRVWDKTKIILPIVMLNPSTADSNKDDPTIRRLIAFANRDGFGGIMVVNLHAYRATEPKELFHVDDPFGMDNDNYLSAVGYHALAFNVPVVAAWGFLGGSFGMDRKVAHLYASMNVPTACYGKTRDGCPRHPLYLSRTRPLEPFQWVNR